MDEPIKRDKLEQPVAKQFTEQGRNGETFTAKRQPPPKRHDFISRIVRKPRGSK